MVLWLRWESRVQAVLAMRATDVMVNTIRCEKTNSCFFTEVICVFK